MQLSRRVAKWKWVVPVAFVGALVLAKKMNSNPPINSARTSPDDPDLSPQTFKSQPEVAAPQIAKLRISTYGRSWKFVRHTQVSPDEIQLQFRVPVVVFTDLLTISLHRQDGETMMVNIESHSQVGQGDFGENRRHVRQMMAAIAELYSAMPV